MAKRDDDAGTLALLVTVIPWLLAPVAGFFLFFGDGPREGPDPRDQVIPWYFGLTGLLALFGVVMGIARGKGHRVRMVFTVLLGSPWVVLAAWLVIAALQR